MFVPLLGLSQQQAGVHDAPPDSGKHEFILQAGKDTGDFAKAIHILKNEVSQYPKHAEYRYFLGYAYDRLNANDGKMMLQTKRELTLKASEQFEEVNRLQPIYKGEIFILDPYSKITSIWGSLAEAYINRGMPDSANWAFNQGKLRGGFIDPILHFNRQVLNSCEKNTILITYGDNITIPMWYLQSIEHFRDDITVIDANLINAAWYPKYLKSKRNLKMSLSDAVIDTIEYISWKPKQIEIQDRINLNNSFTWELKPTYMNAYILKGDRILLDIISQNIFSRPIYFTGFSDSTYNLFLLDKMVSEGLVDKLLPGEINWKNNKLTIPHNLNYYSIDTLKAFDILKSKETIVSLNQYRWAYFNVIMAFMDIGDMESARKLISQLNERFPTSILPYTTFEMENYFKDVFIKAMPGKEPHN